MNAITSKEKFIPSRSLSQREIQSILFEFAGLSGIISIRTETDYIKVEYHQELLSPDLIKDALLKGGFPFKREPSKKGFVENLILKLGEENNKAFGGHPPKCCGDTKHFNQKT